MFTPDHAGKFQKFGLQKCLVYISLLMIQENNDLVCELSEAWAFYLFYANDLNIGTKLLYLRLVNAK